MKTRLFVAAAAALTLLGVLAVDVDAGGLRRPTSPTAATRLIGAEGGNNSITDLMQIGEDGGVVAFVGKTHPMTGMAFHPTTGVLYGVTTRNGPSPRNLITVNPDTGAFTVVGPLEDTIADITFHPDGTLYGWSEDGDDLSTIDIATGATTVVGASGLSTAGSGLAWDHANSRMLFAGEGSQGELYEIDRTTGLATLIATLDDSEDVQVSALAFSCDGGTLFATLNDEGTTRLATIDPDTGHVEVLGPTVGFLDALVADCPWIDGVYGYLLGRTADPGGRAFFNGQVASGISRVTVAAAVAKSPEFFTNACAFLYDRFLGRAPDAGGLDFCRGLFASGRPWEIPAATILGSPEYFTNAGGTNDGFVAALYADLLGRAPSSADTAFWTGLLTSGTARSAVGESILKSPEGRTVRLAELYLLILGRPLDSAGRDFWLSFYAAGNGERELHQLLLGSPEYVALFRA